MELRFALHDPINKSQLELLNAVGKSEIHTFGWPIGIILDRSDEFRPQPVSDGIRAEVALSDHPFTGTPSYDYWILRNNGDFYLLQSLFEDERAKNKLFFNTRIVRVTESFLFCANLYENLGVAPEAKISVRITHTGLAGRHLTSSSPNRRIIPRTANESVSETQIVESLGQLQTRVIDHVRKITEPLFMLFDFTEFDPSVYEDIVTNFIGGRAT